MHFFIGETEDVAAKWIRSLAVGEDEIPVEAVLVHLREHRKEPSIQKCELHGHGSTGRRLLGRGLLAQRRENNFFGQCLCLALGLLEHGLLVVISSLKSELPLLQLGLEDFGGSLGGLLDEGNGVVDCDYLVPLFLLAEAPLFEVHLEDSLASGDVDAQVLRYDL